MKILVNRKLQRLLNESPIEVVTYVALFGLGTIGSQIYEVLQKQNFEVIESCKLNWGETKLQIQFDQIKTLLSEYIGQSKMKSTISNQEVHLELIWAAGKAGFSATAEQTEAEFTDYLNLLQMVLKIKDQNSDLLIRFHLFSSAGGVFEGLEREICQSSLPLPKRPYGQLKLKQELALIYSKGNISKVIYRPSSVYGFIAKNKRSGLIPTMIENGIQKKVSMISGDLNTLRDYVHAEDIAFFVAYQIIHRAISENQVTTHFLISGKPTTILEVKILVEFYLRKQVYANYMLVPGNSANITFHPELRPFEFKSRDISFGVKSILQNWGVKVSK